MRRTYLRGADEMIEFQYQPLCEGLLLKPGEYSGVKSITCPAIGNHHSGQTEISIPEMEITNILS